MRLKPGFVFHRIGEEYLAVATGPAARTFSGLIRNNETADFLYRLLQQEHTEAQLAEKLCEKYGVSAAQAQADVQALVKQLRAEGLLDE